MFTRVWQGSRSTRTQHVALLALLLQPALLLIDFGHFQYNSIMLGFTLLAMNFFASGHDLFGAICFTLSLGFKQMALYYAPAIGSYLLAKCLYLGPDQGLKLFIRLGVVTAATFTLLFLPFLPPFAPLSGILQPINRIFPFARGLFEDKVANFWCASNVAFKWNTWFSRGALVKLSTALTAVGFLPSVVGLLYSGYTHRLTAPGSRVKPADLQKAVSAPPPFLSLLPYALMCSSMSFFLFSFQVHEKTILVPLLPLTLLLSGSAGDSETFELAALVNNVAVFSMWPLLKRDGLGTQYIAMLLIWNRVIGYNPFTQPRSYLRSLALAIYIACISLHILELILPPPAPLPDIYPVLNVLISTPVFGLTWLWSIKRGVEVGWATGGLVRASPSPSGATPIHGGAPVLKASASMESTSTTTSVASAGVTQKKLWRNTVSGETTGRLRAWSWAEAQKMSNLPPSGGGGFASSSALGGGDVEGETGRVDQRRSVTVGYREGAGILRTASTDAV
ncbi:hypothetical protein EUX98_g5967 [Antrodiella citrinella]|uniref:Alpha-1,3-glucosyltransferase n=1 Tax=Antrodiella citrinella TaxID=2447956 RepID=A0A4S4MS17_9APHY|nr:hypothetical protein EUX98_g5967 [Antrodiella citrinella]